MVQSSEQCVIMVNESLYVNSSMMHTLELTIMTYCLRTKPFRKLNCVVRLVVVNERVLWRMFANRITTVMAV